MTQLSRLHKISIVMSLCLLAQMAISWKVWLPIHREFPLISAFGFLNVSYGIVADAILYGLLVCFIIALLFRPFSKLLIGFIICIFFIFILEDITRFQPWVYMFALMLFSVAILKPKGEEVTLFAIRVILAGTYFWSGMQKINHSF